MKKEEDNSSFGEIEQMFMDVPDCAGLQSIAVVQKEAYILRLTNCFLITILRQRSHIRSQSFILLHRCGSTTPSSKNAPLETNLKPLPVMLFQNPNSKVVYIDVLHLRVL